MISATSEGAVKFALILRVLGLGEVATLKLLLRLAGLCQKPAPQSPQFYLTNRIRSDGGGSQVIYSFFSLAAARALGIPYCHRPFRQIEHDVHGKDNFVQKWNSAFNFALHHPTPPGMPVFSLGSRLHVLRALASASKEVGITSHRIRELTDEKPEILEASRGFLAKVYAKPKFAKANAIQEGRIVFHLRRGDVSPEAHPARFTPIDQVVDEWQKLQRSFPTLTEKPAIVTDLERERFKELRLENFDILPADDPFEALRQMVEAPVLVTGVSSFSYLAALLSHSTVIYRDFWHPPMNDWISLSSFVNT